MYNQKINQSINQYAFISKVSIAHKLQWKRVIGLVSFKNIMDKVNSVEEIFKSQKETSKHQWSNSQWKQEDRMRKVENKYLTDDDGQKRHDQLHDYTKRNMLYCFTHVRPMCATIFLFLWKQLNYTGV